MNLKIQFDMNLPFPFVPNMKTTARKYIGYFVFLPVIVWFPLQMRSHKDTSPTYKKLRTSKYLLSG